MATQESTRYQPAVLEYAMIGKPKKSIKSAKIDQIVFGLVHRNQ
jgi:hypothetical protein